MYRVIFFIFCLWSVLIAKLSYSAQSLWTITPLTVTKVSIPFNHKAIVKYKIINQSNRSHTLMMNAITGIVQTTLSYPDACANLFTLDSHQSCTLILEIVANQIPSGHLEALPQLCDRGNLLQCYTSGTDGRLDITVTGSEYTLGGTISDLSGTIYLQNNNENPKAFDNNGSFVLATDLVNGDAYHVTVQSQPAGQICTVANSSGIVHDSNIENIAVTCTATDYTVGGIVTGLSGALFLLNDYFDQALITSNGPFTFPTPLPSGSPYDVIIAMQPTGQVCTVTNGSGLISNANITNVVISCPTLLTSLTDLALETNGQARMITVSNSATTTAENLSIQYPAWPVGTTSSTTCGNSLAPNETCTITVTPGANATSNCNTLYTEAVPGVITVSASNSAAPATTNVVVLTYGCIYQKGFVYDIDDTTSASNSIAGKIAALTNNSSGIQWSNGVDKTTGASDWNYGSINTAAIIRAQGNGSYAAKTCANYSVDSSGNSPCATNECYSSWYLPAICQMGAPGGHASCTGTPNMITNLPLLTSSNCSGSMCLSGNFWSSTEFSSKPLSDRYAWYEEFSSAGGLQDIYPKNTSFAVRCSRDLTF